MEPNDNLTEQLNRKIRDRYDLLDKQNTAVIDYGELAIQVLNEIDDRVHPATPLMHKAAELQIRGMARAICRERLIDEQAMTEAQPDLFDYRLQPRYAITRDGRECSILRESLTYAERILIEARLRNEGIAKIKHADKMHFETQRLVDEGKLSTDTPPMPPPPPEMPPDMRV